MLQTQHAHYEPLELCQHKCHQMFVMLHHLMDVPSCQDYIDAIFVPCHLFRGLLAHE